MYLLEGGKLRENLLLSRRGIVAHEVAVEKRILASFRVVVRGAVGGRLHVLKVRLFRTTTTSMLIRNIKEAE